MPGFLFLIVFLFFFQRTEGEKENEEDNEKEGAAFEVAGACGSRQLPTMDLPAKDARDWAMLAHLSTFSGHFIPFGHIAGPLIIWCLKKDEMPFVNDQGKEALNFQITMTLAFIVAAISILILVGLALLPAVWLFDVIVTIIAAVKANEGVAFRYPCSIRFVS